ncbi:MAG: anthranilate synthase component I family protein [Planctomycetota bacterium]|nr:anthranilate synthase component I family protein [Planctomycetota bacterium]
MPAQPTMQPLHWKFTPETVLAHWPPERALAALATGTADGRWGRWTVLAEPSRIVSAMSAEDALRAVEVASTDGATWIAALSYELGGAFEPRAYPRHRVPADGWPMATLASCEARLVYDHESQTWQMSAEAAGLAAATSERIERGERDERNAVISGLEPDITRAEFESMVARAVELIHAGDIFQANIAQRFSAHWNGSPRAILRAALHAARPRYGAYLETGTHALVSMSPELFVEVDRLAGRAITRPIKGTRAFHEDPRELLASGKDAAELHMIVDLMRNDLGRIALPGGVRVTASRKVESHETVHHCVAEIEAILRPNISVVEMLRATFPPGSITGAPKVRAMQVIDELEPVARGPYCGTVGLISPTAVTLNVAIRTIALHHTDADSGTLRYSAGCGIVAESQPRHEYEESLHKCAVLLRTAHALTASGVAQDS